ncbi:MAG TPA: hypothetical protein VGD54_00520, partial [Steroidobacteraceae bacterium]
MKHELIVLSVAWFFTLCSCGEAGKPLDSASTTAATSATPSVHMDQMPQVPATVADWARGAMLFEGLGNVHRPITTSSVEAQKYFDQGLALMWAFNHDEATRSFAKAAELDPKCASCYWGVSLTVGPNYNLSFLIEERAKVASEALAKARENASRASPVEKALITALFKRYPTARPLDPATLRPVLIEYADAIKAVAMQFPQDYDVQTLYAEAMMNINAWKLWTPDGKPTAGTEKILVTLESVLAHDPEHPGANHYYVHAIEASLHPERAVAAAERLKTLMPAAGHLVHMPAHIMQRI